ncbi:MAG: carboxypeptidase-like regulatory domain-containing protein [candidate division WOR-3 bacterium]|nr:MAG: carboxypeptidase-like regulatory domain-containing protein [candidate division WOR-3 bacterium]
MNGIGRTLSLVVFVSFSLTLAGEYGSIAGRIVDKETNRPLVGAQIMVEGTSIKGISDQNGYYFIPYVRAGTYIVTGSVSHCLPSSYVDVCIVADHTTFLGIQISGDPLGWPSVQEGTNTDDINRGVLSARDIECLPVTTPSELIQTQSGIVTSNYGLHLRGSTSDDIAYYVDGLVMMWPYVTGWQHIPMPLNAVEQFSLQSDDIESEYGQNRGGVVNIVTRQAGTRPAAKIQYFTDEIFSGDKLNFGSNNYNISASGPLPGNFGYFLSGDLLFTNAFQESKYRILSPRNDYHGYGKLTYKIPGARGQLSVSGFRAREQWVRWNPYIESGNNLKYFSQRPMTRTKYWYGMAALDYRLSSSNLTSLRFGITHLDRCYGNRDYIREEDSGHSWYDDYRFKAEHLIPYLLDEEWQEENSVTLRNILVDSIMAYHTEWAGYSVENLRVDPWGIGGLFKLSGDYQVWSYFQARDMQIRLDINQYLSRRHELKAGIHYTGYSLEHFNNPVAWASDPLWDHVERNPYRISAYLQNNFKVFGDISFNVGLRLDDFNPRIEPRIDTLPVYSEIEEVLRISPRVTLAVPLTNKLTTRFNYSHYLNPFFTFPYADDHFYAERTVAYEYMINYAITRRINIGLDLYHRRHYDWSQIKNDQYDYVLYDDREYEECVRVSGALLEMRVMPWQHTQLNISYNYQFTRRDSIEWWWGYYYPPPVLSEFIPAAFDETHQLRIRLDFEFPQYPTYKLLRYTESSVLLSYHSGQPYTPTDLLGNVINNRDYRRMPDYWNVDWRITRRFRIGSTRLVLSALIFNLFNTTQITYVYTTTGDPDDHGDTPPSSEPFGYTSMASLYYSPQADFDHDGLITPVEARDAYFGALMDFYNDPTNYAMPFRVRLGIGIEL